MRSVNHTHEPWRSGRVWKCIYMQWEERRNRFMVTNGVAHVTPVQMLRHFGCTTQPGGETTLQCCIVGRNGGASATQAPEDAIRPRRFSLFSTDRRARKHRCPASEVNHAAPNLGGWLEDPPGVIRVGAHVKLVSRWEVELSLVEAFQDRLCDFSHVELRRGGGGYAIWWWWWWWVSRRHRHPHTHNH